jgi:putative ABC transport system substrate-binding protein
MLFANYAAELVKLNPDVLFCDGTAALEALRQQTRTIPIVFAAIADPVAQGYVASLSHPDGNITGFSSMDTSIAGKWLEMLTQIVPPVANVAILYNPATMPNQAEPMIRAVEQAARPLAVTVRTAPVNDVAEISGVAAELAREQRSGMEVLPSTFAVSNRAAIIDLAARHRLPAV